MPGGVFLVLIILCCSVSMALNFFFHAYCWWLSCCMGWYISCCICPCLILCPYTIIVTEQRWIHHRMFLCSLNHHSWCICDFYPVSSVSAMKLEAVSSLIHRTKCAEASFVSQDNIRGSVTSCSCGEEKAFSQAQYSFHANQQEQRSFSVGLWATTRNKPRPALPASNKPTNAFDQLALDLQLPREGDSSSAALVIDPSIVHGNSKW